MAGLTRRPTVLTKPGVSNRELTLASRARRYTSKQNDSSIRGIILYRGDEEKQARGQGERQNSEAKFLDHGLSFRAVGANTDIHGCLKPQRHGETEGHKSQTQQLQAPHPSGSRENFKNIKIQTVCHGVRNRNLAVADEHG
jgi:hypothetical protein